MQRIVKLGGSLLNNPRLVPALRDWLSVNNECDNWIICGGGAAVDALRDRDRRQPMDPEMVHWWAIRLMDEAAGQIASLLPEIPLIRCNEHWQGAPKGHCFLQCFPFLKRHSRLPRSWRITSDSIAAELAMLTGLDEVCLLKSCLPTGADLEQWRDAGFVDSEFPDVARSLRRVTVVKLPGGHSLSAGRF